MGEQEYDLIGDIHGHADELIKLLKHLGYQLSDTGYCHPQRKVIFLGDFIDRGEHLRQHIQLLNIVMSMVSNGHALAVMGNHEFNALAFHTTHNGEPLRPHSNKNLKQHKAFLNEFENELELKMDVLNFFWDLPLWLELDGLRVIHACWHDEHVRSIQSMLFNQRLTQEFLVEASTEGTLAYKAVEVLLKGVEVKLPAGISFEDKDGNKRTAVRVEWWNNTVTQLGQAIAPANVNIGEASKWPLDDYITRYPEDARPCFIGHYWLKGKPKPLAHNVACLDYSVAKKGKLVAYRWCGEKVLHENNFTHALAATR